MNKISLESRILQILLIGLIVFGFYLCFIGGYGSDEDTLPMIYVFEAKLADGRFVTSRFTGYPIPEIGIGFLAYNLGSWAANSATFLLHLISLYLIFISFIKKIDVTKLFWFFVLALSSPVLYFDNLEPIDYSWAFAFFSAGIFFLSRKYFELAILSFAFAIGCRLNFVIFSILAVYFFDYEKKIEIKKKIILIFCIFIVGGLFYLPIWYHNSFGLNWITAARPIEQGISGLLARFSYKTWLAVGFIQSFLVIFILLKNFSKVRINKIKVFWIIILSNLLLFLYIPAELSYLQPAIIFLYLFFVNYVEKKFIIILIFLNFFNWIVNFQILNINYKDNSICAPKNAISANLELKIIDGSLAKFFKTRKMISCWVNDSTERGKRILRGKSTKIPQKIVK